MNETIALQFSYRTSFETWVDKGLDVRERTYYAALRHHGYDVVFVTYDKGRGVAVTPEGIRCFGLSRPYGKRRLPVYDYFFELWGLLNLLSRQRIRLLRTTQLTGVFHGVPAKLLTGSRLIVRCGYEWMDSKLRRERSMVKRTMIFPLLWAIEFAAYLFADKIIISNHAQARFIEKWFPLFRTKVSIVRNYIDTDFYSPGDGGRRESVLYVGRLVKNKNVDLLIRACASLDLDLTIVGDGPEQRHLEAMARVLGGKTKFVGRKTPLEVRDMMRSHSVFVLPSSYEGSPKALLEAMACGMAVVATKVSGSEELVEDGVTGFLCPAREVDLANAIRRASNCGHQIVQCGREFVVKNCSFDVVLRKEVDLIRGVFE